MMRGRMGRGEEVNVLLLADYIALVADSEEKLTTIVKEFRRVCERKKAENYCSKKRSKRAVAVQEVS